MRARIIVGVALVMALFCVGTFVSQAGDRAGQRQWTVVNFTNPVQVRGSHGDGAGAHRPRR